MNGMFYLRVANTAQLPLTTYWITVYLLSRSLMYKAWSYCWTNKIVVWWFSFLCFFVPPLSAHVLLHFFHPLIHPLLNFSDQLRVCPSAFLLVTLLPISRQVNEKGSLEGPELCWSSSDSLPSHYHPPVFFLYLTFCPSSHHPLIKLKCQKMLRQCAKSLR